MTSNYLIALGITLLVEIPLALLVLQQAPWRRVLLAALAGNLLTHVTIHFGLFRLGLSPVAFEVIAESFAFAAEAGLYGLFCRNGTPWHAVLASALANAVSYGVGLVVLGP